MSNSGRQWRQSRNTRTIAVKENNMKTIEATFRGRRLLALLVLVVLLPGNTLLAAQGGKGGNNGNGGNGGNGGIAQQVAELQQAVAALTNQVHALQSELNSQR